MAKIHVKNRKKQLTINHLTIQQLFTTDNFFFSALAYSKILFSKPPLDSLPLFGPNELSCATSFRIGIDCNQTLPVPRRVARNNPSPPNTIERSPPAC